MPLTVPVVEQLRERLIKERDPAQREHIKRHVLSQGPYTEYTALQMRQLIDGLSQAESNELTRSEWLNFLLAHSIITHEMFHTLCK